VRRDVLPRPCVRLCTPPVAPLDSLGAAGHKMTKLCKTAPMTSGFCSSPESPSPRRVCCISILLPATPDNWHCHVDDCCRKPGGEHGFLSEPGENGGEVADPSRSG